MRFSFVFLQIWDPANPAVFELRFEMKVKQRTS
eukprot:COSAG06_NODE_683_length_13114_cov_7.121322_14_plen_33_part_00